MNYKNLELQFDLERINSKKILNKTNIENIYYNKLTNLQNDINSINSSLNNSDNIISNISINESTLIETRVLDNNVVDNTEKDESYTLTIINYMFNKIKNVSYPFDRIASEENFIYSLYLPYTYNVIDIFKNKSFPNYNLEFAGKNYIMTFNNTDSLSCFISMFIINMTKRIINSKFSLDLHDTSPVNNYDYPDKINSINFINTFITYFPSDAYLCCFYIEKILEKLDVQIYDELDENLYEIHLLRIIDLHINFIYKIIYSLYLSLTFLKDDKFGLSFDSSDNILKLVIPKDFPTLNFEKVVDLPQYFENYTKIKKIDSFIVNDLSESTVFDLTNIKWYDFIKIFPEDSYILNANYLTFKKNIMLYVYPYDGYFNLIFDLFYIRGDDVALLNNVTVFIVFKTNQILLPRSKLTYPIELLPGNLIDNIPINIGNYISCFSKLYGIKPYILEKYFTHGCNKYTNMIKKIDDYYKIIKNNSLDNLFQFVKSKTNYISEVFYSLIFNRASTSYFKQSFIKNISVDQMNEFLFLYVCSFLNVDQKMDPNLLDINVLLSQIKQKCIDKYNSSNNRVEFYKEEPSCICLYNDSLSPYCYDTRCKSLIKMRNYKFFEKTECKYPNCNNVLDFENLIVLGNSAFNNIELTTVCGTNIINNFSKSFYLIYFNYLDNRYIWARNHKNNNVVCEIMQNKLYETNEKYLFYLEPSISDNLITIYDIYFDNNILKYKDKNLHTNIHIFNSTYNIGTSYNNYFLVNKDKNPSLVCLDLESLNIIKILPYLQHQIYKGLNFIKIV